MSKRTVLCLGAGEGFHASALSRAAELIGVKLHHANYESLMASIDGSVATVSSGALDGAPVDSFDAVLTRTMPAGSMEQITFRLATLHALHESGLRIVNPPRSLEVAIDKYATLQRVASLGYPVPSTTVCQTRNLAMDAFRKLGGDCVVKPIFGGEGRGVMRVRDEELAWTVFSTLERTGSVFYVQQFVLPGGSDTRLLVMGDEVLAFRRHNEDDFRTNTRRGARCSLMEPSPAQIDQAITICRSIGLTVGAVDLIEAESGDSLVLEINAIPGWKAAQKVAPVDIAQRMLRAVMDWNPTVVHEPNVSHVGIST